MIFERNITNVCLDLAQPYLQSKNISTVIQLLYLISGIITLIRYIILYIFLLLNSEPGDSVRLEISFAFLGIINPVRLPRIDRVESFCCEMIQAITLSLGMTCQHQQDLVEISPLKRYFVTFSQKSIFYTLSKKMLQTFNSQNFRDYQLFKGKNMSIHIYNAKLCRLISQSSIRPQLLGQNLAPLYGTGGTPDPNIWVGHLMYKNILSQDFSLIFHEYS